MMHAGDNKYLRKLPCPYPDTMLHCLPFCLEYVPYSTVVEVDALNGRDIDVVLVLVVLPLHLGQAHHPLPLVLHVFQVQRLAFGTF